MDLANLTPEQLVSLKQQLAGVTDTSGRSPMRPRQLHDLRLLPTADDPRPTFLWSAVSPRDGVDLTRTTPYPRLMWHAETGEEITVNSKTEFDELLGAYTDVAPVTAPVDPVTAMRMALDGLSDDDRALVVEAQRQERMKALQSKLAALPAEQVEALLSGVAQPIEKRRPGRPRKEQVA